jgi:two-component system sensor histidine kinase GlrK
MKVSSRIISGFGVILLVAIAALAYQVSIIYKMQSINNELSSVNFSAAHVIQKMEHLTGDVEDFVRKYFAVNGEPLYENELEILRQDLDADVAELRTKARTTDERNSIDLLAKVWDNFWTLWQDEKNRINPDSEEASDPPASLIEALDNIEAFADSTASAFQSSRERQVNQAAAAGRRATTVSLVAGATSLMIAVVLAIVLVRGITDPLRQLTQGTRRISKGQFWHRLPASGGDEFADLARDFNAMAQRLSELDQMKKDFVSHVSHELKAPLASMRQVFLLLLQEIAGPLNEQQRRLLRLSQGSAERLSAMVGNLLDVSRMEAGTMEYEIRPHDIVGLTRAVAEEFEVQARDRKIRVTIESMPEASAQCDRDRIVQVIGNLFENGLKFAPEGSDIVVRIGHTDDGKIKVALADRGTGVPDEHKTRIFEKFHQVKRGKKITGQGVGLGLAICKTIIEAHNGSIWVEDNPGGGSVFCFVLHAAVPAATTLADTVSAAGQAG